MVKQHVNECVDSDESICAKSVEVNVLRIQTAKAEAGITEQTGTWSRSQEPGFEVKHGSKSLFGTELIYGAKGEGATYKACFFGRSQVQAVA